MTQSATIVDEPIEALVSQTSIVDPDVTTGQNAYGRAGASIVGIPTQPCWRHRLRGRRSFARGQPMTEADRGTTGTEDGQLVAPDRLARYDSNARSLATGDQGRLVVRHARASAVPRWIGR